MIVVLCVAAFATALTLVNVLFVDRLENFDDELPPTPPRVSLLIPVRNEARNLPRLISQIRQVGYAALEVIFLDDGSTDDTADILQRSGMNFFKGAPPPPGWLGKTWACHQLSKYARGDLFIFCDADVSVGPLAVRRTVAAMARRRVDSLTALPRQELKTWSEKAVVPLVMHQSILSLLPLPYLRHAKSPALLVANGQWLAIGRGAYVAAGGHAAVKDSLVEDMALARNIRKSGGKLLPVIAARDLTVRMYRGWPELREGFSKNLFPLMGGNVGGMIFFLSFFVALNALTFGAAITLSILVLNRIAAAGRFRAPLSTLAWHPVGTGLLIYLTLRSFYRTTFGEITWRGRTISPEILRGKNLSRV